MAEELLTLAKPFLIASGGSDGVESMGSSNLVAAGAADRGAIDTM